MTENVNITRMIGTLISARLATLMELQTYYGVRDMLDMHEAHVTHLLNSRGT